MATTVNSTTALASNVYLFKNGYGMFVKTFEFPPNNDKPVEIIDPPSNPIYGTFWVQSTSNKTKINSIRAKKTRAFVDKECSTLVDLLQANIEQDVQLLVTDYVTNSKEWISGKIKSIQRAQDQLPEDDDSTNSVASVGPANLLLFETIDHGLSVLSLSNIHSIRGATLKTTYQRRIFKNCLSINYTNTSGSTDIGQMKYLTFGITWAPSYNLVLLSSKDPSIKRLRLSAKAVILNDIENLNVENLFCIVGFPNISKFASIIDPIISGNNVQEFLINLQQCETGHPRLPLYIYPHINQSIVSNSVMTQQCLPDPTSMSNPVMIKPTPISTSLGSNVPDNTQQDDHVDDLHLYGFKNILLQKKERLMLPIFDIETSYKDVYHCKINEPQSAYRYAGYEEKKQYEEVWHSVEFENTSNFVWTTAPIVITKGEQEQQYIGQDTLTYTLKGSTTFVNLTKALDVRIQLDEKVTNTNSKRFTFLGAHYQTDQIQGKIEVMNFKSEEVVVVINLKLTGKMSDYSIAPTKDAIKVNEYVANQYHDIRWEVHVKPKETLEINYVRMYNKRA